VWGVGVGLGGRGGVWDGGGGGGGGTPFESLKERRTTR